MSYNDRIVDHFPFQRRHQSEVKFDIPLGNHSNFNGDVLTKSGLTITNGIC